MSVRFLLFVLSVVLSFELAPLRRFIEEAVEVVAQGEGALLHIVPRGALMRSLPELGAQRAELKYEKRDKEISA